MAVYTQLTEEFVHSVLKEYRLGEFLHFEGISDGVENSNYRVRTDETSLILTVFEEFAFEELDYFLRLAEHWKTGGIHVPCALPDARGRVLRQYGEKPFAFFPFFEGRASKNPDERACFEGGSLLARLHREGADFSRRRESHRGADWWMKTGSRLLPDLEEADRDLLKENLRLWEEQKDFLNACPAGAIHGDFFPDNVLFHPGREPAVIDIYNAYHSVFLFDLAVMLNAWCMPGGSLCQASVRALLRGYQTIRPLEDREREGLNTMLRITAMRFWISRLEAKFLSPNPLMVIKDPRFFRDLLKTHSEEPFDFLALKD